MGSGVLDARWSLHRARQGRDPVTGHDGIVSGTFNPLPGCLAGLRNRDRTMSDTYIIEVSSKAAGIVVRDSAGYRFFAASHRFNRMEGQVFRNAREAERAAIRLANGELTIAA
jgi:hypothetical protein